MRDQVERSLRSVEPTEEGFVAVLRFDPELPVFAGHFPGHPLVPGVFLTEGVRLCAERALGRSLSLVELEDARFTAPVSPGDPVRARVQLETIEGQEPLWRARADLETEAAPCARLRLRLRGVPG